MRGVITCSCCLPSTLQAMPFLCRKELLEKLSSIISLIFPLPCILYFLVWASLSCLPAFFFFPLVTAAVIAESPRLSIANSKNIFKATPGADKYPTWHVYMLSPPQTFCCSFCFFWSRVSLLAAFLCNLTHHLSAPLVLRQRGALSALVESSISGERKKPPDNRKKI